MLRRTFEDFEELFGGNVEKLEEPFEKIQPIAKKPFDDLSKGILQVRI